MAYKAQFGPHELLVNGQWQLPEVARCDSGVRQGG